MSCEYFLSASEWSSARLRLQHELTIRSLDGHVLDPSVPPLKPGMVVADVACGTGVWLLDAVEGTPDVRVEGLDINLADVPSKGWLPDSVSFRQLNILEDLPDEYVSRYDIVNAQFASSFVRDPHIRLVMGAFVKILIVRWSWMTAEGDTKSPDTVKLYNIIGDIFGGYDHWKWLNNVEQIFKHAGFEDVVGRRPKAKPSTLQPNMIILLLAQLDAGEMLAEHSRLGVKAVEQRKQRSRAAKEAKELSSGEVLWEKADETIAGDVEVF